MAALTLKAHHHIDHMFEHTRPGDIAILGDMADQHQRSAAFLGEADQLESAAAHLADRAWRAFDLVAVHGLDRIDYQQGWRRNPAQRGQDIAHRCRGGKAHRRTRQPQPFGPQPHLPRRLLAADIDHLAARLRHFRGRLQQQRRFADPGITAHQDGRTRHQSAAQCPVEFGQPCAAPLQGDAWCIERLEINPPATRGKIVLERKHRRRRVLGQRIPLAAIGALPLPAIGYAATGGTGITAFGFGHAV